MGEKSFIGYTDDEEALNLTFQMAEVTRPLSSVGKITDQDNLVVFGRKGGYIWDVQTGATTHFSREQGVYLLRLWVPKTVGKSGDFVQQS